MAVRFPGVFRALMRAVQRQPATSRIRRLMLAIGAKRAIAALNRGDHGLMFLAFAPTCESDFSPGLGGLGFEATRALPERISAQEEWREAWGGYRFDPRELYDLADDRVLVTGTFEARAPASGFPMKTEWGVLVTLGAGEIVREQTFWNRAEALHAAGLEKAP
jgi:hypothetical protein